MYANSAPSTHHEHAYAHHDHHKRRITWPAIFAGVMAALILTALFNFLGLGLGFSTFKVDSDAMSAIGIGSIVWLIITNLISSFVGGWLAARFAKIFWRLDGSIHGFITWAFASLIMLILMATSIGGIINGTTSMVSKGVAGFSQATAIVGKGAANIAPQLADAAQNAMPGLQSAISNIQDTANQALKQADKKASGAVNKMKSEAMSPEKLQGQLKELIGNWLSADDNDKASQQEKLVSFLTDNTNMTQEQAEDTVNGWKKTFDDLKADAQQKKEEMKQQAIQAAEKASDVLATISLITFFTLLLGAIAGIIGGMLGSCVHRNEDATHHPMNTRDS